MYIISNRYVNALVCVCVCVCTFMCEAGGKKDDEGDREGGVRERRGKTTHNNAVQHTKKVKSKSETQTAKFKKKKQINNKNKKQQSKRRKRKEKQKQIYEVPVHLYDSYRSLPVILTVQ